MSKKIRTEEISLNIMSGTIIYIDIDTFRFLYDENDMGLVKVSFLDGEEYKHFENVFLEEDEVIVEHEDLRRVALNWIFDNVEIVAKGKVIESVKEE
ncbi:hypothetical protein SAMN02745248_02446 [Hathewaya proteolytica DSM 3090]|uniref:Uncharacterized protein n=1 Tax=Hathewaya proteolytica DSM 3090 TaxID=1121331 RepID=A0A1M6S3N4_9CLOT|nr:ubiquitin [Hathewaya proteolytica]SHK39353.1 hypothetical protein SAMN02745248_02446 [Hathewaya proteolytica DSM 3090]